MGAKISASTPPYQKEIPRSALWWDGNSCNVDASEKDGGRCQADSHNRCSQYVVKKGPFGLRTERGWFRNVGPPSCQECRCIIASLAYNSRPFPKPRVRYRGDCLLEDGGECRADECFRAGGRCLLSPVTGKSGMCHAFMVLSNGKLEARRWKVSGQPRDCVGCLCTMDTKRKAEVLGAGTSGALPITGTLGDGGPGTASHEGISKVGSADTVVEMPVHSPRTQGGQGISPHAGYP